MAPPRRKMLATAEETLTPPDDLAPGQQIARVLKATGNNLYAVEFPSKKSVLVELPSRFRSTIWIKRKSYVVVDTNALEGRDNKLGGEIVNIVRDEKAWRKERYWPKEFVKQPVSSVSDDESEDESNVGKLPPSDDDSDA
ncbi:putative eukaryotic translation initiation factor eIF1a-like protein [Aspergillus candidus]|uniref:Putative eukaryotic translation initiation factor eIF1a-like protein n=1 Tax=Aspergillus candidus TaxID=41067 RepID=A0A2I2FN54_ASPCN|nr:putative eukaryotic translation initiation factor eIF1a-like protein [Aspergillus candidus]PLB42062.1 putative eukaryotic translation initiation factor eIF1a-like protein [Aspergillus candidus]